MKQAIRILFLSSLFIALIMGAMEIMDGSYAQDRQWCCNNNLPLYSEKKTKTSMYCEEEEEEYLDIPAEICARWWSVYGENPQEMCEYLPGIPPLLEIPIPNNFRLQLMGANSNDVIISWTSYPVHWYQIWRKPQYGTWSVIKTETDWETYQYIDWNLPGGQVYYYKMRGSVYDVYSDYTREESIYVPIQKGEQEIETSFDVQESFFELLPNYPNPFNPVTNIEFILPEEGTVNLAVYNLRGEVVKSLIHDYQPGGKHMTCWNGTDEKGDSVPSGIYITRFVFTLSSGGATVIKLYKMNLVK